MRRQVFVIIEPFTPQIEEAEHAQVNVSSFFQSDCRQGERATVAIAGRAVVAGPFWACSPASEAVPDLGLPDSGLFQRYP